MHKVDALVVGAGVIGLATARELSQHLEQVLLVDKHRHFGEETSSRNSEVIHAGLYYPSNSLKAKLCVQGKTLLYQYCQQRHIAHQKLGKLLVAESDDEIKVLEGIEQQALANNVCDLSWLDKATLSRKEPHLKAKAALLSPSTGIVDVHAYMQTLLADLQANEGQFVGQSKMLSAIANEQGFEVTLDSQGEHIKLQCRYLINSAGLHSCELAQSIVGLNSAHIPKLHWCRGHYFTYQGKSPFKQLIYPIPSDNGLGIHASLDTGGQLKFGPDTQYVDQLNYQVDPKLKDKFVQAIKQYFPTLNPDKLQPGYSGIRPKLQGPSDSFKDFVIQSSDQHGVNGLVNLFGIDSPGLTSSLAIAKYVGQKLSLSH
ncbi:NAD(P)/FAD-dependent oxidoreductase [Thalassotalea sp. PLHSN55]|uniref:NAD(P)/FAD-dependent oxidoreductase n=1 Tax=Thalassotalea sp. PLHSN55 TaxID=3435888 RepID=UPI003F8652C7